MNTSFYVLYHNRLDELSSKFSKFVENYGDKEYLPSLLLDTDFTESIGSDEIKVATKDWVSFYFVYYPYLLKRRIQFYFLARL